MDPASASSATAANASPLMQLYPHELRWAHRIKEALAKATHIREISDMEIAQYALISSQQQQAQDDAQQQDNDAPNGLLEMPLEQQNACLQEIVDKAYKLQCFRELYHIEAITASDSSSTFILEKQQRMLQLGMELIAAYVKEQQPGHLLSIDYMSASGHYLIVWDRAAFFPLRVKSEPDWRIYQGCTYHLFLIMNSHFQAMRQGVSILLECDGMQWRNYDSQFEERRVVELFNYYPFRNREFCFLHAPTVAILLYKICKPFLSQEFHQKVVLDGKIDGWEASGQRIDGLYKMPTLEESQDRLLARLSTYLQERLHFESTYSLPPLSSLTANATQNINDMASIPRNHLENENNSNQQHQYNYQNNDDHSDDGDIIYDDDEEYQIDEIDEEELEAMFVD